MANTVYANKVIESKLKDLLNTKVNTRNMMTIDTDLEQDAGMTKTINLYTYSGVAEALSTGEGNTAETRGSISYTGKDYTVKVVQQAFDYYDEEAMKDPFIVDSMLAGASQVMVNKMNADFIGAITSEDITNEATFADELSYDAIVDAISTVNVEDESELFVVIPNSWKAGLRKDNDYVAARMGEVVYNGQVGQIAGIPIIATKALDSAETAVVMSKEAVKLFLKRDVEVEQDRNKNTRQNSVYLRATYLVALVDATKICKITQAEASE